MSVSENSAHRERDTGPLFAFRFGTATTLGRQRVVLARAARGTVSPDGFEQTAALHLMERRIHRALFQLKGLRAATLGLLDDFIAVHLALCQETENQHSHGASEELAIVIHAAPYGEQGITLC